MPAKTASELIDEIHSAERELLSCNPQDVSKRLDRYLKLKEKFSKLERRS